MFTRPLQLNFRYQDVPWLESVIERVQRCQEDESLRQSPRVRDHAAPARPPGGAAGPVEQPQIERQSDWQAAERIVAFEKKLMQQATGGSLGALYQELPKNCEAWSSLHTTATTIPH